MVAELVVEVVAEAATQLAAAMQLVAQIVEVQPKTVTNFYSWATHMVVLTVSLLS